MKRKKRPFTLLEIMIAIFLIGLIGSVIGYNMKGSLDKGKAFKTEMAINKVTDILELQMAEGVVIDIENPDSIQAALEHSGMVKDAEKTLKDGWGNPLIVNCNEYGDLQVRSEKLEAYNEKRS